MEIINLEQLYKNKESCSFLRRGGYTVYRIHNNITNMDYVGDTGKDINWRFFEFSLGAHFIRYEAHDDRRLYRSMHYCGLAAFDLIIEYNGEKVEGLEKDLIEKYDSYKNGYNNNPSGKYLNDDNINLGRVAINKDGVTKKVLERDLSESLELGWNLGASYGPLESHVFIMKDDKMKAVPESKLQGYLESGWLKGSKGLIKGYKWMHNDEGAIRVPASEVEDYLKSGYKLGSGYNTHPNYVKRVWVHDGARSKHILYSELDSYLAAGYMLGRIMKKRNKK